MTEPQRVPSESNASTQQKLIESAIHLYAEYGTKGVSLRQIVRHANVANDAAVRYHFKNKEGLVAAVVQHIGEMLVPNWSNNIAMLARDQDRSEAMIRRIVLGELMVMSALRYRSRLGKNASIVLARLIREEGRYGQTLLIDMVKEPMIEAERILCECMPQKSPKAIRLHHFLAINSILNGLVDQHLLKNLPDPDSPEQPMVLKPTELLEGFVSYVTAGLMSTGV